MICLMLCGMCYSEDYHIHEAQGPPDARGNSNTYDTINIFDLITNKSNPTMKSAAAIIVLAASASAFAPAAPTKSTTALNTVWDE